MIEDYTYDEKVKMIIELVNMLDEEFEEFDLRSLFKNPDDEACWWSEI